MTWQELALDYLSVIGGGFIFGSISLLGHSMWRELVLGYLSVIGGGFVFGSIALLGLSLWRVKDMLAELRVEIDRLKGM